MRLIVFSWRDPTHPRAGGSEVYLFNLLKHIEYLFDEVICYTSTYPGASKTGYIGQVKIVRTGHDYFPPYIALKAKEQLKKYNNFLILESINHVPFYTPILYPGHPVISIIYHTASTQLYIELPFLAPGIDFIERAITPLLYRHKTVIVPSKSTKQQLMKLGFSRVHIVAPGISCNIITHQAKKYAKKAHTLIYFGRIVKYKQIHHIIQALPSIKKEIPEIKLIIAGKINSTSYLNQLHQLITKLDIQNNVEIKTNVSEHEKIKLLTEAQIYITTSIREGWGIAVTEANACGTPAISYDVVGLRDSIIHDDTGLLVPYGDLGKLSQEILLLLNHEKLREKFSRNALVWSKRFSSEKTSEEFLTKIRNYIPT